MTKKKKKKKMVMMMMMMMTMMIHEDDCTKSVLQCRNFSTGDTSPVKNPGNATVSYDRNTRTVVGVLLLNSVGKRDYVSNEFVDV